MEFYSKKRSIGRFDKYIIMISEILSQISEIEYLKINFFIDYDRIDLNTISKYMNKYKKYLVVTNDDILVYYDQDDYYYCYYPLIDKLIKNLRDTYSNNTNQNINYEINNKLIDINQKLKKIQEQQTYNEELNKQKEDVNSLEFIEEMARDKLGMYYPNERVYVDNGM